MSVSGSSVAGHCSNVSNTGVRLICRDPTSSVLFDGVIPTLTGLDGDMWASQLLALQKTTITRPTVTFDFTDTPGYVGLSGRLEVVMINCLNMGISASTIRVHTELMDVNIGITSCDSLVRVCTPIMTVQPSIALDFVVSATFDIVYLAEVTFYAASSASTCPPDTITTAPPDTIITTVSDGTTPPPPNTTIATTPSGTTFTSGESTNTTATTGSNTITSVIIPVVVVICVVFMIVGIMVAVLILWRYHKHKTSHHTALGEGHSHSHTHSHPPPVKMCEETGQVCYSSLPEALGLQLSPSHDTYSHLQRDTSEGRGGAQSHRGGSNEDGGYSTLSHGNSPHVLGGGGEDSASQLYAQVDKKEKKKKSTSTEMSTLATYSSLDKERSVQQVDTAMDQLYDRVDNHNERDMPAHPNTSEADTTDQLYAQVDKKKVKKKKGEVATHSHTPETGAPMDQLYAQVDKKKKQKKCEVTVHPDADTAVNQLYAQVDKKKRKVCKDSNSA